MKRIGLIAGGGQFPVIFAKAAQAKGYAVYAVAHIAETDPELEYHVTALKWIHLGQIKRLLKFFHSQQVTEAVMMGNIAKSNLFKSLRPDTKAIALLTKLRNTHDDGILRALAEVLDKGGVTIQPSTFLVPEMLAEKGIWTKCKPTHSEKADIEAGWQMAKAIGRLDIGQCLVIEGGTVLAVEAIDGTDATIERAGRLGGGHAVVIKVCKPSQDLRFDIPAIGVQTIRTMKQAGAKVLAIEAGRAVVFDKTQMIAEADAAGIAIVAIEDDEIKGASPK